MSDTMAYCKEDKLVGTTVAICEDNGTTGYERMVTKTYSNCVKMDVNHCNMTSSKGDYFAGMNNTKSSEIVIRDLPSVGTLTVKFYGSKRTSYLSATDGKTTIELKYADDETPGADLEHAVTKTAVFNSTAKSVTITHVGANAINVTDISVTPK